MNENFKREFQVAKADTGNNLLIGWAVTSTDNGQDVIDKQNDIVEFGACLDAALEYAKGERPSLRNHAGEPVGTVVFLLPLDSETAKGLEVSSRFEGLIAGVQVDDATMGAYRAGKLTGLSIAGTVQEVS